jgi:hypothetical protein
LKKGENMAYYGNISEQQATEMILSKIEKEGQITRKGLQIYALLSLSRNPSWVNKKLAFFDGIRLKIQHEGIDELDDSDRILSHGYFKKKEIQKEIKTNDEEEVDLNSLNIVNLGKPLEPGEDE